MTFLAKVRSQEEIYLKEIHRKGTRQDILDLHCYFYEKGFECCPICNEWIILRSKPEATI